MLVGWQTEWVSTADIIDDPQEPAPTRRQWIIAIIGTTVRLVIGGFLIAFMLTLVPETPDGRMIAPVGVAIVGTVLYILFSRRQLRRITHSRFPNLMAAEALVLLAALFLAVFSMIYVTISVFDERAFTEPLDAFTSYYFSLTVLATVGFGDITPITTAARSVTMVQMAMDLVFVALLIRLVTTAARRGMSNRAESARSSDHEGNSPTTS